MVLYLPSSRIRIALALASSKAVTQRCLSTSELAFKWKVCVPPLEITKLQESSVCRKALARLIVPRQVCCISAWFLLIKVKNQHSKTFLCWLLQLTWERFKKVISLQINTEHKWCMPAHRHSQTWTFVWTFVNTWITIAHYHWEDYKNLKYPDKLWSPVWLFSWSQYKKMCYCMQALRCKRTIMYHTQCDFCILLAEKILIYTSDSYLTIVRLFLHSHFWEMKEKDLFITGLIL